MRQMLCMEQIVQELNATLTRAMTPFVTTIFIDAIIHVH